ncbi:MAG: radical SAM protein, partial [Actinomycetia bacterium]|nr:radical SAM protein [Actinomycetes bacterium]
MKITISYENLGCAKNQADLENLLGFLKKNSITITPDRNKADFIIINTCSFLKESRDEALETIILNSYNTTAGIIITGCILPWSSMIENLIPEKLFIKSVYSHSEILNILLNGENNNNFSTENTEHLDQESPQFSIMKPPTIMAGGDIYNIDKGYHRYIKITDGCNNRCSYCLIPSIKGCQYSIPPDIIIRKIEESIKNGIKEIILVGQDITGYSYETEKEERYSIIELVNSILKIKTDFRLRLLYMHPDNLTDEMIRLFFSDRRILKYFEIPFQHVSSEILHKMNRSGSIEKYTDLIKKIHQFGREKKTAENISITGEDRNGHGSDYIFKERAEEATPYIHSSFIVGFPGETEDDFELLKDFISMEQIDNGSIFIYSPEPTTIAAELP